MHSDVSFCEEYGDVDDNDLMLSADQGSSEEVAECGQCRRFVGQSETLNSMTHEISQVHQTSGSAYQIPESLTQTHSEVPMLNVVDEQTTETDEADSLSEAGGVNCEVRDESEKMQFKLAPCFSQKLPVNSSVPLSVEQPTDGGPALDKDNAMGSNLQNHLFEQSSTTVRISLR